MNIIIRDPNFKIISIGKSLRPVAARLASIGAQRIDIWPDDAGGAQMDIAWIDGSSMIADVPALSTIRSWVEKRRRGAPVVIHARRAA